MRRIFEWVSMPLFQIGAMLMIALLVGAPQAQAQVTYVPPVAPAPKPTRDTDPPEGSRTYTYQVRVPDNAQTPCKDFHLQFSSGTCGGVPGPATGGGPGGGAALPGWGNAGGIGSKQITWKAQGNAPGVPPGGTFTVTITVGSTSNGLPPPTAGCRWFITNDGALRVTPDGTIRANRPGDPDVSGPTRRPGLSATVNPAPAGSWATLVGYVGEAEERAYVTLFGLAPANPPTALGPLSVSLELSPFLTLATTPFVRNGIGVSNTDGECFPEIYIPLGMLSGFRIYLALAYYIPGLGEWEVSSEVNYLEVR